MSTFRMIAIDGPAGSGKSSVSKAVAHSLGFGYCDTGAAYRSLAWACIKAEINLDEEKSVLKVHSSVRYRFSNDPKKQVFSVDGVDVTSAIRDDNVSRAVSTIARHSKVREALVRFFRELITSSNRPGIVMEGRDITTVVAPDADVRILLTADQDIRIARRQAELPGQDAKPIGQALAERDRNDSTVVEFMTAADGVHLLDSGNLSFEETVEATFSIISHSVGDLHV